MKQGRVDQLISESNESYCLDNGGTMKKMSVGNFLKKKRMNRGLTLNYASVQSEVAYSTIANWESDAVNDMRIESLEPLLTVYKTDVNELLSKTRAIADSGMIMQTLKNRMN